MRLWCTLCVSVPLWFEDFSYMSSNQAPDSPRIAVVDYGMGNLRSVQKALERVGVAAEVTRDAERIEFADAVVLPGVGAFGACIDNLRRFELVDPVLRVIESNKPFLGICVGLQLLFEESEEFGPVRGLGVLPGRCRRFRDNGDADYRVPHMGWNQLSKKQPSPLLDGIDDGSFVYFVHSYYAESDDPGVVAATTTYGCDFVASIVRDNLFACQFHPEKSQATGLQILRNFGNIVRSHSQMTSIGHG
jgi:glutamine amidotransferase